MLSKIKGMMGAAALAALLLPAVSTAAEMEKLYTGIRPIGMGGAFTAVADDKNAAFYNPAGLAAVTKGRVDIFNPKADISTNTLTFISDAQDLQSGDTQGAIALMRKNVGKHQHLGLDIFPNYTRHNFEIGLLGKATTDAAIHSPAYPYMDVDFKTDMGAVLAFAHSFMEDRLYVGVTAKYIQRKRFFKTFTPGDIANQDTSYSFSDNLSTGSAFGADLGVIYRPGNETWDPRLGAVLQNIGGMDFGDHSYTTGTGTNAVTTVISNKLKQQFNVGAAVTRELWIIKTTVAFDLVDLGGDNGGDTDIAKRMHLGAEFKFPKILTLRAGWNQGYLGFGAGLDLWLLRLDYVYYKEEVASYAGQHEDARQMIELAIGW